MLIFYDNIMISLGSSADNFLPSYVIDNTGCFFSLVPPQKMMNKQTNKQTNKQVEHKQVEHWIPRSRVTKHKSHGDGHWV